MQLLFIFWLLIAYLYGSINNAVLVGNMRHKKDVRNYGSNNSGSTNVLRTFGKKTAIIVFLLDIFKPIIPISFALWLSPTAFAHIPGGVAWVGVLAIIGQCYPLFFHFRGGKGAASTFGTTIILMPYTLLFIAPSFITLLWVTDLVSLTTLVTFTLNTIFVYFLYPQYLLPYVVIVALIIWRHRANIARLANKTEPRLRENLAKRKEKRSS